MLIDTHIHVGHFHNRYFSPIEVVKLMNDVGVDYYSVSSTTTCEENYSKAVSEIVDLIDDDDKKVLPTMWITPDGLNGNIAWYLESDINWKMIKIHPQLHPNLWRPNGQNMFEVIEIAKELKLPILIHTGEFEYCHAGLFKEIIKINPEVKFVLAHGRPLEETRNILFENDNAYTDSAFMPIEHMKQFVDVGLSHKLLWGTDMCIPKYFYPDKDMVKYYLKKLNKFKNVCNKEQFEQVTYLNAIDMFGLSLS